jgi:penicillin-insensitive murein endopeptidase
MRALAALLLAFAVALLMPRPAPAQDVWGGFTTPSPGAPAPVGTYSNGCLLGGEALAPEGEGFQVVRLSRHRYYGHPTLIEFLTDLGRRVAQAGLGRMLVADLAGPRGGPLSGHASHEIGLDADIWLRLGLPLLPAAAREELHSTLLVDRERFTVNGAWTDDHATLIRMAAEDPRVARIFVHPAIKIAMCEMEWADRSFLRTIRPWFGHDSHMHVRLVCPEGAALCEPQTPVPPGDGCDATLYSWIPDPGRPPPPATVRPPPPPLPLVCQRALQEWTGGRG